MFFCALLFILVSSTSAEPGFLEDLAEGSVATVDFATHPADRVFYAVRDAEDFLQFPDKSQGEQKNFSTSEVGRFDGEAGRPLYIVIDDKVYDVTDFADMHPGGPEPLKARGGRDASAAMRASGMPPQVFTQFIHIFRVGQITDP